VGVDGKVGLTNDLTLNFTINPDFGQVEADPSNVNLTNFETYFNEKRPSSWREATSTIIPSISPTMNATSSSTRAGWDESRNSPTTGRRVKYVRAPGRTNILGAVKISGKTRKGTSLGILSAVTQKMYSETDRDGERSDYAVEPLSGYFTGRVEQDLDSGNLIVGGMVTAVNRKIDEEQFREVSRSAYTGGVNVTRYWQEKSYYVTARAFFSQLQGAPQAMTRLQRSSARYYQRPDAGHLQLDSSRTTLSGMGGSFNGG